MERIRTVGEFYEKCHKSFRLRWLGNSQKYTSTLIPSIDQYAVYLAYLNPVRPAVIQIIGAKEQAYLQRFNQAEKAIISHEICQPLVACVLIGNEASMPKDVVQQSKVPFLVSQLTSEILFEQLYGDLAILFAERCSYHGVFISVFGIGVLIIGPSGIGKSRLALSLLERGHLLVADDTPTFIRLANNVVQGYALHDTTPFLYVRPLGLIDVTALYGSSAIVKRQNLQMVIRLTALSSVVNTDVIADWAGPLARKFYLHGQCFPEWELQVKYNHDLCVLLEAKVKQFLAGCSSEDTLQRLTRQIELTQ